VAAVDMKSQTESQIKQLMDEWIAAVNAKDVERVMALYASDVVVFDYPPPLQHVGIDSHRRSFEQWFAMMPDQVTCQLKDLRITAGDEIAFARALNHIVSGKMDQWVRATVCFEKRGREWKVVHEHVSVPIDEKGRGLTNLEP
jgi:uncharacterized protein (TIGR02246 family)